MKPRAVRLLPVVLLLGLGLCGTSAQADSVLNRGNRSEPATLDPHKYNTLHEAAVILDLFEGLTAYGPDGAIVPGVADRWSVRADGLIWTFTLRPDLHWSDGAPLAADDVQFSFRRLVDPVTAAVFAPLASVLKNARAISSGVMKPDALGVTAVKPDQVVIALETPAPFLPELLANAFMAIVPRHAIARFGDAWIKPDHAVGNGAFTLVEWVPQDHVALARNPRYRDARDVRLDRVVYYPTEDLEAAVTRFRAGQLDLQAEFPTPQLETLRRDLPAETRITPALATDYLAFNTRRPKFADGRVRQALSLAIDRDLLTTRVLRGGQIAAAGWVPPAMPGYTPARMGFVTLPMTERIAHAKALLAAAGYGPDHPLKVAFSTGNASDQRRVSVAIAAMWRQIGVETAIQATEGKVFFANLRQGDYEIGFAQWTADYTDAATFLDVLRSGVTSNYSRYNSAAYDALMERAAHAADAQGRADLLRAAETQMLEDQPIAPLAVEVSKDLVSQTVHGWRANPMAVHVSRYLSVDRAGAPPQ